MGDAAFSAPGWLRRETGYAALRTAGLVGIIARLLAEAAAEPDAPPHAVGRRAERTATAILARHRVEVRRSGVVPVGPKLLVANHVSYLDPLVVAAVAPCLAIAKAESKQWPLVGRGLQALGVMFVRRGDPYSGAVALRGALRALRRGASVINFPEGTTSDGSSVGTFHVGCFGLARLAKVPLVPLSISYDNPSVSWYGGRTFLPHYWELACMPRVIAHVQLGEPLVPVLGEGPKELAARAHASVSALLGSA